MPCKIVNRRCTCGFEFEEWERYEIRVMPGRHFNKFENKEVVLSRKVESKGKIQLKKLAFLALGSTVYVLACPKCGKYLAIEQK